MDARPPPPQGPPPSYAFVTRVYRGNMRPVIVVVAVLAGLWSLFAGIGFFRNASYYNQQGAGSLGTVSIVLGALYMAVAIIEAFGIFTGATQRLSAARIFAWLSGLAILLVAGIGLAKVVIHFTMKNTLIDSCTRSVEGGIYIWSGFWGPVSSGRIDNITASRWCDRSWSRGSWSEIISFLCTTFLAMMFASIAFAYYRQLLDPTSAANVWRRPATARNDEFPSHYAPPFQPAPPYPSHQFPNTAPPYAGYQTNWGPGPEAGPITAKPPGYGENWGYGVGAGTVPPENKDPFMAPGEGASTQPQSGRPS